MSTEISTAHVKQFSANVFHLSQQKGSRLRPAVRVESQNGKSGFYDRIGKATAQLRVSRHADTPQVDTPHSRRRVTLVDYEYADLIDEQDKVRLLMDPVGPYTQAAVWGIGRAMDDVIISNALGNAYGGEEGSSTVSWPNTQKLVSVSGGAGVDMNVQVLRRAKNLLDAADVDPDIMRFIALASSQLQSLLGETEVTSSDFNSVKALVQGEVDTFMGFKFIRIQRLNTQSGTLAFDTSAGTVGSGGGDANTYRRCFAWAMDGLLLANAQDIKARVSERADKSYAMQVYASMSIGSTRMEEEKVVEILCND